MACAFVNIDIQRWQLAEKRNLPYSGYIDLAGKPEVYDLIQQCVEQVNADLGKEPHLAGSQIHRFLVLHKELDPDEDDSRAPARCAAALSHKSTPCWWMHCTAAKTSQFIRTQVKFEDGRTGNIEADVKSVTPHLLGRGQRISA